MTLQWDLPSPHSPPKPTTPRLKVTERPRPAGNPVPAAENFRSIAPLRRTTTILFSVGLLAIIGAGIEYLWLSRRPVIAQATTQPESHAAIRTGFSASRDGPAWKLTWDRSAVDAIKPTGAILAIQDGASQQDIPLTMADLASGTIYYSPKTGELAFWLQLQRDGIRLAEERVRVLDGIKPVSNQVDSQPAYPQPALVKINQPQSPISPVDELSKAQPKSAPARLFVPPRSRVSATQSSPILADAEPITTLAIPLSPPAQVSSQFTTATPPPPPANAGVEPQVAPVPAPTSAPAASTSPQFDYVAPRPTRQVQPQLPPGLGPGPAQVAVKVSINAKGKVTKIDLINSSANPLLMIEASKAAGLWEFQPARLNGQPVASEMNVIFRFQ